MSQEHWSAARWLARFAVVAGVLSWSEPARGVSLRDRIPGLFGGQVQATVQAGVAEGAQIRGLQQFREFSALLRGGFPPPPIPSASGAFRFAWDPRFDTYRRQTESLGPIFAERAETIGKGKAILNVSYSHIEFDTFEGRDLSNLRFTQPAFSADFLGRLPLRDRARFEDDTLDTTLQLAIRSNSFFLTGAYGLTDRIDVSLGLTLNQVKLRARATTSIGDAGSRGDAFLGAAAGQFCGEGTPDKDIQCVNDGFDDSAFGTGDVYLRGKWAFARTKWVDLSAVGILTIPTGNADDFLGYNDPTFTPELIASKTFGLVSPHVNLGWAFRSGKDVGQALWVAGADVRVVRQLTLVADFLGSHDDNRDGVNDDVIQSALGVKVNPYGRSVLTGGVQLPLNRDGLRADVIYTVGVEQSF